MSINFADLLNRTKQPIAAYRLCSPIRIYPLSRMFQNQRAKDPALSNYMLIKLNSPIDSKTGQGASIKRARKESQSPSSDQDPSPVIASTHHCSHRLTIFSQPDETTSGRNEEVQMPSRSMDLFISESAIETVASLAKFQRKHHSRLLHHRLSPCSQERYASFVWFTLCF